jgi:glutathione S-transferase
VSLQPFGHPFSNYMWKVLIALWADETPFNFRMLGPDHPENGNELRRRWPFGQFPLLVDSGQSVVEATCIIEHLQAHHPGPSGGFQTESSGGAFASSTAYSTSA